jgi:predicted Zn-dependent protease
MIRKDRSLHCLSVAASVAAASFLLTGAALGQTAAVPQSTQNAIPLGPSPLANYMNLPDMGSTANSMISRADEYQIGRMILHSLRSDSEVLEDPESTEYINNLGLSLGAQAQEGTQQFTFFIVRDKSVNAFALPGGFIGTNVGLVLLTNSESELASVLAHEIGHVVQRHIARAVQAQSRQSLPMMAAMIGAILLGAMGGGEAAMGAIAMAQGTALQQGINFTRMEEAEADRVGISFLSAANYDPYAMASFFSEMGRNEGVQLFTIPDLLKNHPVTTARIAEARSRAAQLPPRPARVDAPSYALIRERIRVISSDSDTDLRPYYAKLRSNGVDTLAVRYGAALASLKAGDAPGAVTALQALVQSNPDVTILHTALGEAQMAAGQQDEALKTFAHAILLYPRNVPVTVRYAEALLKVNRAAQAHQLLLDLFNNTEPTPEQIRLTAMAASAAGDTGDAYFYMAEFHVSSGDLMLATQQLDLALAEPQLTEIQRKRFLARREEIRGYLREQREQRGGSNGGSSSGAGGGGHGGGGGGR